MEEERKEECVLMSQFKAQREFLELRDLLPDRVVVSAWGAKYIRSVYRPHGARLNFYGYPVVVSRDLPAKELLVVPEYQDPVKLDINDVAQRGNGYYVDQENCD